MIPCFIQTEKWFEGVIFANSEIRMTFILYSVNSCGAVHYFTESRLNTLLQLPIAHNQARLFVATSQHYSLINTSIHFVQCLNHM